MRTLLKLALFLFYFTPIVNQAQETDKEQINKMLDNFNLAAAESNFEKYFNYFTPNAIFIGTDATENWDKNAFAIWAKPYFEKKKTWNFKAIQRNIYIEKSNEIAWFDELLDTQMKICRGSGVLVKVNKEWKVQQYVLSMTIPNEISDAIIKMKAPIEDPLIQEIVTKK